MHRSSPGATLATEEGALAARLAAGLRTVDVLEPGMVIALEPGSYGGDEGVRVEQIVLVTDDGCEVLSRHELAL